MNRTATVIIPLIVLAACGSPRDRLPQIAEIYREATLREDRNPVIVIPGILGSRLVQRSTGKIVWGAFGSKGVNPDTPEGARALALPLVLGRTAADYDPDNEDVYADGPLEAIELDFLFTNLWVDVYQGILRTLGVGGYTDQVTRDPYSPQYAEDHYTCFSFFYDWRRSNVENAIEFGRFLKATRKQIDETARRRAEDLRTEGTGESLRQADEIEAWLEEGYRFDVVAHSMGGLMARYYMRYGMQDLPADGSIPEVTWAGAEEIDRLVLVGTPNFGSMDSLNMLINGYQASFILPRYHPGILGTMSSLYDLLPRNEHKLLLDEDGEILDLDLFDVGVWARNGWGLMSPGSDRYLKWMLPEAGNARERRRIAQAYLEANLMRTQRFHEAMDKDPERDCPAEIFLFAADTEQTLTRSRIVEERGRLRPVFIGSSLFGFGDGSVPRFSALAERRRVGRQATWLDSPIPWSGVTFLPDDHLGLTKNPLFADNLLFLLLQRKPPRR